jgi:hypothetical protein
VNEKDESGLGLPFASMRFMLFANLDGWPYPL